MSEIITLGFNIKSAVAFNQKYAQRLGWYGQLPAGAVAAFPGFARDCVDGSKADKEAFAVAVQQQQKALGVSADGKLGSKTAVAMHKHYSPVGDGERFVLHHGRRIPVPDRGQSYRIMTYEDFGGLDLHRSGHKARGKDETIVAIIIHWTATLDEKSAVRVLKNRGLSTHFCIGKSGVHQVLGTERKAYHAAGANAYTIGIDICSTPVVAHKEALEERGHVVRVVENTTGRGDKKVLTLDPVIEGYAQEFIYDVAKAHNVRLWTPRGVDGTASTGPFYHGLLSKEGFRRGQHHGIFMHSHVKASKWDVNCWAESLLGPILG